MKSEQGKQLEWLQLPKAKFCKTRRQAAGGAVCICGAVPVGLITQLMYLQELLTRRCSSLSSAGMQDERPFPHHKRRGREELLILVVGSLQLCLATCQGQLTSLQEHVTCFAMLAIACQIPEGQTSVGPIQHERLSKTLHNAQIRTALHSISQLAACFLHIR